MERANNNDGRLNVFLQAISRDENEAAVSDLKKRMTLSFIFLGVQIALAASSLGGMIPKNAALIAEAAVLVFIIVFNHRCFVDAFLSVRRRQPEKNLLAAIGAILAIAVMQFVTAGVVLTTMAVCRYCEEYIRLKLNSHLSDLVEREPADSGIVEGEVIRVAAGEVVPVDGVLVSGETAIDEEIITGERIPVKRSGGDIVYAGSVNIVSDVFLRTTHTGAGRVISIIIRHISSAITTKSPMSRRYEKIARRFVIAVGIITVITAAIWMVAADSYFDAIVTGIAVLIIANPYAFSVAVPMTVLAAVVRGAAHGILIKSADILEDTRDINTIIINKRGTVTGGDPEISDIVPLSEEFDLRLAGILEQYARHPFGKMIYREACIYHGELPQAKQTESIEGRGVRCVFKDKEYIVGNAALMRDNGIATDMEEADALFRQGKSLVFFGKDDKIIGIIAMRDAPKPASLKAITMMENMGLDVTMVTGDSRQTAEAIRSEIGIDHIFADILPEDKKDIVEKVRTKNRKIVAMVGDGVKDADAIDAADLGIAIGTGQGIEIGTADIVLISSDLLDVVRAMKLSRLSVRNLRQSVAFAYAYNILAIICAGGAFAQITGIAMMPVAAAVCMCISQILVTLNALRIRRAIL